MDKILEINNLVIDFESNDSIFRAVDDISLTIEKGKTLSLVGESGSGKSVTALSILQLLPEGTVQYSSESSIKFENDEIISCPKKTLSALRGNKISMIFQEPMTSLNPYQKVGFQIDETLIVHKKLTSKQAREKTIDLLKKVKIPEPETKVDSYPHQLSGGQRQRVALARAIVRQPRVFLMDEPLSNLDAILRVTTRAELKNLHHRLGVTTIYVTHDQVEAMTLANRIAVMNHGKLLQFDKPQVIFDDPSSKFVAGFIGSPAMNLIDGRVENKKFISDSLTTSFDIDYEGDITLGVRPDKIQIVNDTDTNNGSAKVYSVELTGEANLVTFKSNNQNLIVKTDKNTQYDIDSVLKLNFNKEDCYFFDINSEERLRI